MKPDFTAAISTEPLMAAATTPAGWKMAVAASATTTGIEKVFRLGVLLFLMAISPGFVGAAEMECIRVASDKRSFVLDKSGHKFSPWGFNYDHDEIGRLLEDYWSKEWAKVEE